MAFVTTSEDTTISVCWSCKGPVASGLPFCPTCEAVQPPGQVDHFARLGVTRCFTVDDGQLESRYLALQRRLHPDRFATRSARQRALSMQQATSLNEAYESLRSPLRRAEYLLSLAGGGRDAAASESDPEVLVEAMEDREALAEADTTDAIAAIQGDVAARRETVLAALAGAFDEDRHGEARRLATRLAYLDKLVGEARARRATLAEAS